MKRAALVAAAILAIAVPAHASPGAELLDRAQQAIDDVDYTSARDLTYEALMAGGLERDELIRAYRLAGEVAAALGDEVVARDHFTRWILLDPSASLRPGVSPKINGPFNAARGEVDRLGRMDIDVRVAREADRIKVSLASRDPLKMIGGLRVRLGDASEVGIDGTTAVLPAADPKGIDVAVAVVDRKGNVLLRVDVAGRGGDGGGRVTPAGPTIPAGPRSRTVHSIPAPLRWPTWAGLAVLAGGAGGYFLYRVGQAEDELAALNADSNEHTFDEALVIQERGDRDAMLANIALGVGGAAALAAILTLVLDDTKVEVLPAPTGASVGASAALRF